MQNSQNCRIGRQYKQIGFPVVKKCVPGKLCYPVNEFEMIEKCTKCKKVI